MPRIAKKFADYGGLVRVAPGVVVCLTIIFVSLVGIPPMAGFAAKYVAFAALVQAMTDAPLFRGVMLSLLVVGGLNTALSLFYYLRVIKTMAMDPEPADRPAIGFSLVSLPGAYVVLMTIPVLVLGIFWNQFFAWLRFRRVEFDVSGSSTREPNSPTQFLNANGQLQRRSRSVARHPAPFAADVFVRRRPLDPSRR